MSNNDQNTPHIEELADGGTRITLEGGRTIEVDSDGNVNTALAGPIKSVGIENIIDLESYSLTKENGTTTHHVVFKDGGHVRLAYTDEGKLVAFTGSRFGQSISKDNELMLKQYAEPSK